MPWYILVGGQIEASACEDRPACLSAVSYGGERLKLHLPLYGVAQQLHVIRVGHGVFLIRAVAHRDADLARSLQSDLRKESVMTQPELQLNQEYMWRMLVNEQRTT